MNFTPLGTAIVLFEALLYGPFNRFHPSLLSDPCDQIEKCDFSALEDESSGLYGRRVTEGEYLMKKLALALVAVLSLLSIAGCATAPPPPMVHKG